MKKIIEKIFIKILKSLKVDLLAHAHVQIGAGHNAYFSGEEFIIHQILPEILGQHPKTIFDVGANIGNYAISLRNQFPQSDIYCFEPVHKNYNELIKKTADLNLKTFEIGFSSQKDQLSLFSGANISDGSMATLYPECFDSIFTFVGEVDQGTLCQFETIDDFLNDQKIAKINFLKIDVEGHELNVLKGAKLSLENKNIDVIQFEFNEFNIISKSYMKDFYNLLKDYQFYRIMPQNKLYPMGEYNSSLEIFRYQNILAIHKTLNHHYE